MFVAAEERRQMVDIGVALIFEEPPRTHQIGHLLWRAARSNAMAWGAGLPTWERAARMNRTGFLGGS